jgi:hypothetical protein
MAGERHVLHTPSTAADLPSDWSWKRLDAVCEGVFDCPHSTPVLTEEGPYLARSQNMRSGVFRTEEAARVSEATYKERIARAKPRHGDLLYSREGTYFGIAAEVPAGVRVCLALLARGYSRRKTSSDIAASTGASPSPSPTFSPPVSSNEPADERDAVLAQLSSDGAQGSVIQG